MSKWKLAGLCVLILALVAAIVLVGIMWSYKRQLNAQIASIKASGAPVTAADLAGEPIPDEQNGAVVYRRVWDEMDSPAFHADLQTLRGFAAAGVAEKHPELREGARQALARSAPLLDMVEEATSRPTCRFDLDWARGEEMPFPEGAVLHKVAVLCRAGAILNAQEGNMDEAMDFIELGVKLSESLREEPSLMLYIRRTTLLEDISRALRDCPQYGDISEEQAARVFHTLAQVDLKRGYIRTLEGERALFLITVLNLTTPGRRAADPDTASPTEPTSATELPRPAPYQLGLWRADTADYLSFLGEQIGSAQMTYKQAKAAGVLDVYPQMHSYSIATGFLAQVMMMVNLRRYASSCKVAGDQVFLALLACKDRCGSYPEDLDELRQKLAWDLPKDTFSDEDFLYKRQGKGFLLYSVGPNMRDDGGVHYDPMPYHHTETGDYVWKLDR